MSHASGEIVINKKVVAHFEYNGTADVCCPKLHHTREAMEANWRNQPCVECTCGAQATNCLVYTSYGSGFYWPGSVCLNCMCIVEGFDPFEAVYPIDGHPLSLTR